VHWAQTIGPHTARLFERIMNEKPHSRRRPGARHLVGDRSALLISGPLEETARSVRPFGVDKLTGKPLCLAIPLSVSRAVILSGCFGFDGLLLSRVRLSKVRLVFLASVRFVFGCGASAAVAFFSDSDVMFISFLLTGLRS
jgi:hypothetical protein